MKTSVNSPEYVQLREFLTTARIRAEITQQDLASALGKHQSFVSKYERGDRRVDVVEFTKICVALGLEPHREINRVLQPERMGHSRPQRAARGG